MSDDGWTDAGAIERELDDTRSRLDATLGALQQKLAPGTMVDQAVEYFTEGGGVEIGRNIGRSMRDNPIPVALIGVGIGWLLWSNASPRDAGEDEDWRGRAWSRGDRLGHGADRDLYGRRSHRYGGGFEREPLPQQHRPMPYEAAASDDLASKAQRAGAEVRREAGEAEDAFQDRVAAARASVLGLTRNAGEALDGFRARIERALGSAADSARSLASSAGDQAERLAERGRETMLGFYEQGASALHEMRDRAGDAAGQVRHLSSRTIGHVQEQPLLLGALGITVGAAMGMLLPSSRYERRMAASLREGFADLEGGDLASAARERVAEVAGRARHIVEETAAAGREAVRRELVGEPERGQVPPTHNGPPREANTGMGLRGGERVAGA